MEIYMKKGFRFLTRNYVFILLAFFWTLLLSGIVADIVYSHVRYDEVTFKTYAYDWKGGSSVKIIDNNYREERNITESYYRKYRSPSWSSIIDNVQENKGFTLVTGDKKFENFSYFEADSEGACIIFRVPVYPTTSFTVLVGDNQYGISIENSAGEKIRDIGIGENYSDEGYLCCAVFSAKDYGYIFLQYFITYAILFIFILLVLVIFWRMFLYILHNWSFCSKLSPLIMFFLIAGFQFIYVSIRYFINPGAYEVTEMADAYYYMHPIVRNPDGQISIKTFVDGMYAFRGYIPSIIAAVCNSISARSGINIMLFYFILYAVISAFTFAVCMPLLYESLTDNKATNVSVLLSYVLFFIFWEGFLCFYLSDIPAALFAVCAIAFGSYGIRGGKKERIYYLFSGLFIGMAGGYRSAYSIVAYGLWVVIIIRKVCACRKKGAAKEKLLKPMLPVLMFGIGAIIILLPQFLINVYKGHIGFFPFNSGWKIDAHTGSIMTLTESSFTEGLHRYNFMGSDNGDKQLWLIDSMFCTNRYYSIKEILYLLLTHPLEFIVGYCKKLFWAMSASSETIYTPGPSVVIRDFMRMLNYFLVGTMLYALGRGKNNLYASKKIKILYILGAALTIFPQAILHIERRYFLFYFLLIYFYVGFIVLNGLIHGKNKDHFFDNRYFIGIIAFIIFSFAASNTILYSF